MDVNVAINIPQPVNVSLATLASNPIPPAPLPFEKPLVFDPAIRKHWFTMPFNGTFRAPTSLVNVASVTVKADGVNKTDGNPINAGQQVLVEITATNPAPQASLQFNAEFLATQLSQETLQWQEVKWMNHYGLVDAGEIYKGHPFALSNPDNTGVAWGKKAQGNIQVTSTFELGFQLGQNMMMGLHSSLIPDGTSNVYIVANYSVYRFSGNLRVYKSGAIMATVQDNDYRPLLLRNLGLGAGLELVKEDGSVIWNDPSFAAGNSYYLYPFTTTIFQGLFYYARAKGNIITL